MMLGFRATRGGVTWNLSVNDPYLYVKICDPDTSLTNNLPSSDALANATLTKSVIVQSILDDINNLDTSFLVMALYFDGAPTNRTIEVCAGTPGALGASGNAQFKIEDGKIISCTIKLDPDHDGDAKKWLRTTTHEIGHCLGLMHPQESIHAIMSYYSDQEFLRYQIDDLMGISFLYPSPSYDLKETSTFGLKCSTK